MSEQLMKVVDAVAAREMKLRDINEKSQRLLKLLIEQFDLFFLEASAESTASTLYPNRLAVLSARA